MSPNNRAIGYIFVYVIATALFTVLILLGDTIQFPFYFAALTNIISVLIYIILIYAVKPELFSRASLSRTFFPPNGKWLTNAHMLPGILNSSIGTPIFIMATAYINIAVVAIIYDINPIMQIFLQELLFKKSGRYKPLSLFIYALFGLSLVGIAFTVLGEYPPGQNHIALSTDSLIGITLSLAACALTSVTIALNLKHGTLIQQNIAAGNGKNHNEFFCAVFSTMTTRIFGSMLGLAIAATIGETLPANWLLVTFIGALLTVIASMAIRRGNYMTDNLGVNSIRYTKPIVTLMMLFAVTRLEYHRIHYLIIGTTLIFIASIFSNVKFNRK